MIVKKLKIVCSLIPLAVVLVFSRTWRNASLWGVFESVDLFPPCVVGWRSCRLLELFKAKVDVTFFMYIGAWADIMWS